MLPKLRSVLSTEGRKRGLIPLFFPILLFNFSSYFFIFVEKLFLARFSAEALNAAVAVVGVCQIFQASVVSLVMMLQVYVGKWTGEGTFQKIGPGVWQLIWFSFLSMGITVPLSLWYGNSYFEGTFLQSEALPYFYFFVGSNFLYPLAAAFTCFYFGQGKKMFVVIAALISQVLKLFGGYILIFGWGKWIPAYGLLGGAISTLIAQLVFCLFLFYNFSSLENHKLFNTREWQFRPKLFWECIHPGLLRIVNRVSNFFCWAEIGRLMLNKGESYALVLSIGSSLFILLEFLASAVCQVNMTVVSQLLGEKEYNAIKKSIYPAITLALSVSIPFALILFLFPIEIFNWLFPTLVLSHSEINSILRGIGMCFLFFTLGFVPTSYVLAFKDMYFILWMGLVSWIILYLPVYLGFEIFSLMPSQFWFILSLGQAISMCLYFLRVKKLCSYQEQLLSV